ncbi:MAG: hypothetical protein NXI01_02550 [Gammaproteobacteria bacterium]|nr:hypothetical protein [Gammaproteobacteria bacterium]
MSYLFYTYHSSSDEKWTERRSAPPKALEIGKYVAMWLQQPDVGLSDATLRDLIVEGEYPQLVEVVGHRVAWKSLSREMTLSLSALEPFRDLCSNAFWRVKLNDLICDLRYMALFYGCSIGIDFSEVFLVENNQEPPERSRFGVDVFVTTSVAYRQQTVAFAYQFSKAFIRYLPAGDLSTPFDFPSLQQMNTPLEAEFFAYRSIDHATRYFDLNLGPQVEMRQLRHFFKRLSAYNNLRECHLTLHGKQYEDEQYRKEVCEQVLVFIEAFGCQFLPHILLKDAEEHYLDDERLSRAVLYNIQTNTERQSVPVFDAEEFTVEEPRSNTYIIRRDPSEATEDYRASKQRDTAALQASTRLTVTHTLQASTTHAYAQEQEHAHEVTESQELAQTVTQQHQHQQRSNGHWDSNIFRDTDSAESFTKRLMTYACKICDFDKRGKENLVIDNGYFTAYHQQTDFWTRLTHDQEFAEQIARSIFGRNHYHSALQGLSQDSFVLVDSVISRDIIEHMIPLADGLDHETLITERGLRVCNMMPAYVFRTLLGYASETVIRSYDIEPVCLTIKALSYANYQTVISVHALLRPEDVLNRNLTDEQRDQLHLATKALLQIFKPGTPLKLQAPEAALAQLRLLIVFHCPDKDIAIWDKFTTHFGAPNRDHLKVVIYLMMQGYSFKLNQLLDLLLVLDQRDLLGHFYKIYFQYAQSVLAVADFLHPVNEKFTKKERQVSVAANNIRTTTREPVKYQTKIFLEILQRTPPVSNKIDWPLFEKFVYHFLVHAARLNLEIRHLKLKDIEQVWMRIYGKILKHTESKKETQYLMNMFLTHLCTDEGFDLKPVCLAKTILTGLEEVITRAIENGMLEEQLREWGISLLWTDALYMLKYDRYKIVTRDMGELPHLFERRREDNFHLSDHFISSYVTSAYHLRALLQEQCMPILPEGAELPTYDTLRLTTFRYLGGESLREPIAYYRQLYAFKSSQTDPAYVYFKHLLFGYFVLTTTGEHYTQSVDHSALLQDFLKFLQEKSYETITDSLQAMNKETSVTQEMLKKISGEYSEIIRSCVQDFLICFEDLKLKPMSGRMSLWLYYQGVLNALKPKNQPTLLSNWGLTMPKAIDFGPQISKSLDWFGLKIPTTYDQVPAVFKKQFDLQNLAKFISVNRIELLNCASFFEAYPDILGNVLVEKIKWWSTSKLQQSGVAQTEAQAREKKIYLHEWLLRVYPKLTIQMFLKALVPMETVMEYYFTLAFADDYADLKQPLELLMRQHIDVDVITFILELIVKQCHQDNYDTQTMAAFLNALSSFRHLLGGSDTTQALITVISSSYFNQPNTELLVPLLMLAEELALLEPKERATKTLQSLMKHLSWHSKDLPFYMSQDFSGAQLEGLAKLLESERLPLEVIKVVWQEQPTTDFTEVYDIVANIDLQLVPHLGTIALALFGETSAPMSMPQLLEKLAQVPVPIARQLAGLIKMRQIAPTAILQVLDSDDMPTEMARLERSIYCEDMARFDVNVESVSANIAKIRYKSTDPDSEDQPLTPEAQALLLKDYQIMMSYMRDNPVLVGRDLDGEIRPLTVHELSEPQRQILYQKLQIKLSDATLSPQKKQSYRLMLLALVCEAFERPAKKFPQETQILCQLHALRDPHVEIQGVKTGGGKSIIAAMRAIMLCAEGWTADTVTESEALARAGLEKFQGVYEALDVPHAKRIIEPNSCHSTYVPGGINHSTPANLSFFRAQMTLQKKFLPTRVALLCDEIDAILTTIIQYRLAGVLDPIFLDLQSWSVVFTELLSFVQEKELFLDNYCDDRDDVHNFKHDFSTRQHDKKLTAFIEKIPKDFLNTLLDSARVPEALRNGEDYRDVIKRLQKIVQYAAPIMNVNTKRPEPSVSYADGVQELLHAYREAQLNPGELPFLKQAITETLLVIAAKNFFDFYRLNGGLTCGWTGTPGATLALQEFANTNDLHACSYPIFHPDLSENLGVQLVDGVEAQHAAILARIRQQATEHPEQSVLILTDSPKAMVELRQYLATQASDLEMQSYDGHAGEGLSEEAIVARIGIPGMVTAANLSLSRGTDPDGLLIVINGAADITAEEADQANGRAARNGEWGQYCHIINAESLAPETAEFEDPAERFKAHQAIVSARRQRERLKTRLLEEVRNFVVTEYFFKLRATADKIFERQYGMYASVIVEKEFLLALRDFNKYLEQSYTKLLGSKAGLSAEEEKEFINQAIAEYQRLQDHLIPDQKLESFQAIEPLIPIHLITSEESTPTIPPDLTLKHVTLMSQIFASGWRAAGHQNMQLCWDITDDMMEGFDPYFNHECSFRVATAQTLERRDLLHVPKITAGMDELKTVIRNFDWTTAVDGVVSGIASSETMLAKTAAEMVKLIFPVQTLEKIKTFVLDYLETTKQQIHERRWDDLALPDFEVEWIQTWLSRIQTIFTTFAYITQGAAFVAGPVYFVVTKFVLPTVLSWIKVLVKRLFADSESKMVQILIGLDDAFDDIAKAVMIFTKDNTEDLTIETFLDEIAPLLKNKAILAIINKLGESQDWTMGPILQLLPEVIKALDEYKDRKFKEIARPEILMKMLTTVLKSEYIKSLMEPEAHEVMLQRLESLPKNFVTIFKDCKIQELLALVKVIAHPQFSDFLSQLPPEACFQDLIDWLKENDPKKLPPAVQGPKQELDAYQENHERIAENTQQECQNLKRKFHLRPAHIEAHRMALLPKQRVAPTIEAPAQLPSAFVLQWLQAQWLKVIVSYTALLLCNYLLFSFSVLLISAVFTALIVSSILRVVLQHMATMKLPDEFPQGIAPPLGQEESPDKEMSEYAYPTLACMMKFGVFKMAAKTIEAAIQPQEDAVLLGGGISV